MAWKASLGHRPDEKEKKIKHIIKTSIQTLSTSLRLIIGKVKFDSSFLSRLIMGKLKIFIYCFADIYIKVLQNVSGVDLFQTIMHFFSKCLILSLPYNYFDYFYGHRGAYFSIKL